jgi:hypothetical protein
MDLMEIDCEDGRWMELGEGVFTVVGFGIGSV